MTKLYRQGEVLIKKLDTTVDYDERTTYGTDVYTKRDNKVIVEGEQTGHMHAVSTGTLYEKGDRWSSIKPLFLHADTETLVTHDEYETIKLPAGDYEITFQREYDEAGRYRRVTD